MIISSLKKLLKKTKFYLFIYFRYFYFCNVTPPRPHIRYILFLEPFPFLAGDQPVVPRGVTHISCHYKDPIGGTGENKTNEQTRTMLGVNSEQKESMQHYISVSIYGLTLAWITSENSTKQLECRHLDSIFFAGPYLLLLCPESTAPVRGSTPTLQLLCPTNSLLASRYLFRPRRDFKSKNPLSGFTPKQTKELSAWRATYIVLHFW